VVSRGQTGVDRAALDAAQACGLPRGGWSRAASDLGLAPRDPRCMACGAELAATPKAKVAERIPPRTVG